MAVILVGKTVTPVQVDREDALRLAEFRWSASPLRPSRGRRAKPYARGWSGTTSVLMHRFLLGAPPGVEVDHINGDGLDNRRANLRLCTHSENAKNRRPDRDRSSKGAQYDASRVSPFRSRIRVDGKQVFLGWFKTQEAATAAYDVAARKYHGAFARPNR